MAIALAIGKQKAIPCKYGDGYGSMPPDMAQWVPDGHARRYNMTIGRTERCALKARGIFKSSFRQTIDRGPEADPPYN